MSSSPPDAPGGEVAGTPRPAQPAAPTVEDLTRVVALDGPAGSGKSTVSRLVAEALGWRFVDTGATYRAVTLAVLRSGVDLRDGQAVAGIASGCDVQLGTDPGAPAVTLNGEDVSAEIRGPEVTSNVSTVSAIPQVREHLIQLQRRCMGTSGSVVEGRDIATVVAPRAAVKVYLDARPEIRARRRAGDAHMGVAVVAQASAVAEAAVQEAIERRDALDGQTNRLEVSDGAVHLDTSDLSLPEVVRAVVDLVREAGLIAQPDEGDARG